MGAPLSRSVRRNDADPVAEGTFIGTTVLVGTTMIRECVSCMLPKELTAIVGSFLFPALFPDDRRQCRAEVSVFVERCNVVVSV